MSTLPIPLPCLLSSCTLNLKDILRWSVVRGRTRTKGAYHTPRLLCLQTAGPKTSHILYGFTKLDYDVFGPGPVDLINAVRAPFHVHPPYSIAVFVVRSHLNP